MCQKHFNAHEDVIYLFILRKKENSNLCFEVFTPIESYGGFGFSFKTTFKMKYKLKLKVDNNFKCTSLLLFLLPMGFFKVFRLSDYSFQK